MNGRAIVAAGVLLAMFAVVGTGLVVFTHQATAQRIAENERNELLSSLHQIVPAESIDNDIVTDTVTVSGDERFATEQTLVYLGRKGGSPVAAVFASVVPDGYSGAIRLLVAVRVDGTLGGVRVVTHKETPGLGDKIELAKSDWVLDFDGKSLGDPEEKRWKVKKDGGVFDEFTGATITPRSIVNTVKNTLLYFRSNGAELFGRGAVVEEAAPGAPSESVTPETQMVEEEAGSAGEQRAVDEGGVPEESITGEAAHADNAALPAETERSGEAVPGSLDEGGLGTDNSTAEGAE